MDRAEEIIRPALERKIFHPIQHKKNKMEWPINDSYKRGLRNALTGLCVAVWSGAYERGTSNSFGVPFDRGPDDFLVDEDELIRYGEETWEVRSPAGSKLTRQSILRYMVSSGLRAGLSTIRPATQVLQLLQSSGLMADKWVECMEFV
jgi:transcription initiation factor TFIIH subunit 4